MSAPLTEPFSSVSSSGHVDGLGRRALAFDRETGAMLERLYVRPQLAVFEQVLRRRVEHLATLEEERFARPVAIERDGATGELVVVAEFITGGRLSEFLEVSADASVVPGVDVALGYLLEALPALAVLHTGKRLAHGLIDPSRTVLTEEGQVVFLDVALGPAVECLHLSPQRLWEEFGVSASSHTNRVAFDPIGDVSQAALSALMLVLGRNLQPHEYPDALLNLLIEVIEVAQIRSTTNFATGLQKFLQRALPIAGRRPFASADEALSEVRQLVRREIGIEVCRQAVVDFVAQMDASFAAYAHRDEDASPTTSASISSRVPELDRFLDTFETVSTEDEDNEVLTESSADSRDVETEDDADAELEISLDHFEPIAAPAARSSVEEVYDLPTLDETATLPSELDSFEDYVPHADPEPVALPPALEPPAPEPQPFVADAFHTSAVEDVWSEPQTTLADPVAEVGEGLASPWGADPPEVPDVIPATASESAPQPVEEQEPEKESASARRRKRQQQKSARARKDKLRSSNADQKTSPPPAPAPPKPANPSGWLVAPHRVAAESLTPDALQPPPPQPRPAPTPAPAVSFSPTLVGQLPQPTYATPTVPGYGSPTVVKPVPPPPPPTPPVIQPVSSHVKLKDEPFKPNAPRKHEPEPVSYPDRFSTLSLGRPDSTEESAREFPWRLAAVAVAVAVVAILIGRTYLPGRTAVVGEPGAATEAPAPEAPAQAPPPPKADSPIPSGKGRISIQTQPAGLRVLLDRRLVGETPLQVDAAPGRRVLTFMTSGGEVIHSVRVVAGKTVNLDIPVFSGWVSVIAPVVLNIYEDGRSMGTTEQNRLLLPPGRHRLTLSSSEFGYNAVHEVDIEPGAVRSLTIDAKGTANLNAQPWAEVWLDGTKLGETPLAGAPVPLGVREFIFKHPQFGERRVSATIRASAPTVVAVDFTK